MLFTSPEFLFGFLPIFFIIYFLLDDKLKNAWLFAASLFFYFTTSFAFTIVLILSVVINHYIARNIQSSSQERSKMLLIVGIIVNLAPLLFYKYTEFAFGALNDVLAAMAMPRSIPAVQLPLPIGISFFTFQAVSYIADAYMRRIKPAESIVDFGMYHSCFPQLIAGPIVRYEDIESDVKVRRHTMLDVHSGIVQFCFGLAKKAIIADPVGKVADRAFNLPLDQLDAATAWVGIVCYTLQIYFDFSGYSDMAIGIGRALGFKYPENFNQPYRSTSITEFWRRWHMTLSRWFRDYIYIPLGGNREGSGRTAFNLLIVFVLCGLWHGAAYTFLLWGLYHGILLACERGVFRATTVGQAISYISTLFGFGTAAPSDFVYSILPTDKVVYTTVGIFLAVFPFTTVFSFSNGRYNFGHIASAVALVLFGVSIVMISGNGFTPFIYFRF